MLDRERLKHDNDGNDGHDKKREIPNPVTQPIGFYANAIHELLQLYFRFFFHHDEDQKKTAHKWECNQHTKRNDETLVI